MPDKIELNLMHFDNKEFFFFKNSICDADG